MKRLAWGAALALVALAAGFALRRREVAQAVPETVVVREGPFTVWISYPGHLEARRVESIASRHPGSATLISVVAEGTLVGPGDIVARLDSSQAENEAVKASNRLARARAALDSLLHAEIPLSLAELDAQLAEAQWQLAAEQRLLEDSRDLAARDLVSRHEVEQQTLKTQALEARRFRLEQQRRLTAEHIHPARTTQALADVESEQQQVESLRRQIEQCTLRSPCAGVVIHQPLHVGSEFRTARVGDAVFQNQPFLLIADTTDLVVKVDIPEADYSRVQTGATAVIRPIACPDRTWTGSVESIGSVAESRPGLPAWQKFFRIAIRPDEADPRLRPGMSVQADVLSYSRPRALLIPRAAVIWREQEPRCRVRAGRGWEERVLRLGQGNEAAFEVLDGLRAGEQVLLP